MVVAALVALAGPSPAAGQLMRDSATAWLVNPASEGERYLRVLQLAGVGPTTQWSIRPLSEGEVRRLVPGDATHPWSARMTVRPRARAWVRPIQPEATAIFNSGFAYGMNDGPIWAGRGPTASIVVGVHGGAGPFEFALAPQLFRAENWSYPLAPNGQTGPLAFGDGIYATSIDLPQRFGDGPYQRLDPGQSVVRLRGLGFVAGVSTGNEAWGPSVESPFLLGANAAGFAHLFAGTDRPLALGPLVTSLRIIAGRLDQSPFAPPSPSARRYLAGAILAVGVRQVPGLEVGVARVFQNAWPDSGLRATSILSQLLKNPFKARLSAQLGGDGTEADNQVASAFFRWHVPDAGFELYGEVGREDNAYDTRDLLIEPDRDAAYSLGMQRVWKRADGSMLVLRGEVLNSGPSHLSRTRPVGPPYVHTPIAQGHTQLGQLLGAPGGFAGGAGMLGVDWLTPTGRRSITWRRTQHEPVPYPIARDVVHAVTVDWMTFGPRVDLAPEATVAYNLNRFQVGDAVNLRAAIAARLHR